MAEPLADQIKGINATGYRGVGAGNSNKPHGFGSLDPANFRERYLEPALKAGFIEMTIPSKPRSSKQKYRLSQKGQEFISQLK